MFNIYLSIFIKNEINNIFNKKIEVNEGIPFQIP